MVYKFISLLLSVSFTSTSFASSPEYMASALRPASVVSLGGDDEVVSALKASSSGTFTIKTLTWNLYTKLQALDFKNQAAWLALINVTETVEEADFLTAVFTINKDKMPESWRAQFQGQVKAGKTLAEALKKKLEPSIQTVKIVMTAKCFEIAKAEAETAAALPQEEAAKGDVNEPTATEKKLAILPISVAGEGELDITEADTVAGEVLEATEEAHKDLPEVDSFEDMLSSLGIPPDKVIYTAKDNEIKETLVAVQYEENGYVFAYIIDEHGEKNKSGILIASDNDNANFVISTQDEGVFQYRFKDGRLSSILGPNATISFVVMSEDRSHYAIYFKAPVPISGYNVYVYKIDAEYGPSGCLQHFNDVGELDDISFPGKENTAITLWGKDGKGRMFSLETGVDISPPNAQLKRSQAQAQKVVFPDTSTTSDEAGLIDEIQKAKTAAGADNVAKPAPGAEGLGQVTGKLPTDDEPEIVLEEPQAKDTAGKSTEEPDKIELIGDIEPEEGSSANMKAITDDDISEKPKKSAADIEKKFRQALLKLLSTNKVKALLDKDLKENDIKGNKALVEKLKSMADKRSTDIVKLKRLSARMDRLMEQACDAADPKKAFDYGVDWKNISKGLDIKLALGANTLYNQAQALVKAKTGLFNSWLKIVQDGSILARVKTFAQLNKVQESLRVKFKHMPKCLAKLQGIIAKDKERLVERQKAVMLEKISAHVLDAVRAQHANVRNALEGFRVSVKEFDTKAKAIGYKSWKDAANDAIDFRWGKSEGGEWVKAGVYPKRWSRFRKLWPIRKPLGEVVDKRAELLKQLKAYRQALAVIYDNLKPEDFMLAADDKKGFDRLISFVILGIEAKDNEEERFKCAYMIERLIDLDKYLYLFCRKFYISHRRFSPITNENANQVLEVKKHLTIEQFAKMHRTKASAPVAQTIAVGVKAIPAFGSAA